MSIETHVLDVIREQLSRRQPVDGGSRNVVRTMTSTCGYAEVRSLAAQRLEMWLQNPKVYPVIHDVDTVMISLTGLSLSVSVCLAVSGCLCLSLSLYLSLSLSLSPRFNGHFLGEPALAGVY